MSQFNKICSRCKTEKPLTLDNFNKRKKGSKDGFYGMCKPCLSEYSREQYQKNKERRKRQQKEWAVNNQDKVRECQARHRQSGKRKEYETKYRDDNLEKLSAYRKNHYQLNKESTLAVNREWYQQNKEYITKHKKMYKEKNRDRLNAWRREYIRRNPNIRLSSIIRSRLCQIFGNGWKSDGLEVLLGYSMGELRHHLERQFTDGMGWDNYGQWHVDHIIPVSSFSFGSYDEDEFKSCWALTNLRPLWAIENITKSNKPLFLI